MSAIKIFRNGNTPAITGPEDWFSGKVRIDYVLNPQADSSRVSMALVNFEPNAKTAWHTHPAGQTIIITAGKGYVQQWGEEKQEVNQGDIVFFPPQVKHWHGATESTAMSHIAIQELLDGSSVDWLEKVED